MTIAPATPATHSKAALIIVLGPGANITTSQARNTDDNKSSPSVMRPWRARASIWVRSAVRDAPLSAAIRRSDKANLLRKLSESMPASSPRERNVSLKF